MDFSAMTTLAGGALTLWLATLSWVWNRHVSSDEKRWEEQHRINEARHMSLTEAISQQDARIERAINRLDSAVHDMHSYQTGFNLETTRVMAEVKALLLQR
jgi:hypothetical protein